MASISRFRHHGEVILCRCLLLLLLYGTGTVCVPVYSLGGSVTPTGNRVGVITSFGFTLSRSVRGRSNHYRAIASEAMEQLFANRIKKKDINENRKYRATNLFIGYKNKKKEFLALPYCINHNPNKPPLPLLYWLLQQLASKQTNRADSFLLL